MFDQSTSFSAFSGELALYQSKLEESLDSDSLQTLLDWLDVDSHRLQLTRTFVGSEFFAKACTQFPDLLLQSISDNAFERAFSDEQIAEPVKTFLIEVNDEKEFDHLLRKHRRRFMVRIIWRDLNRLADTEQTIHELSVFAQACVQGAMDFHYRQLAQQWGVPKGDDSQEVQPMLVLGMGKLGAYELNLSSDIDLIFCYPEAGNTSGAGKSLSNQEFFARLGQKLIKSLDAVTVDGFVFRVDMRLRPWGQSGALVANFDALEIYYQTQGREWERYAMIKARVVASTSEEVLGYKNEGDNRAKHNYVDNLMALLGPFTYRKYLDYSAVEALRSMKQLINKEVSRKGLKGNVKLGAGGIREIEFIVQAFQLIRGGRDDRLRERQLLKVLPLLEEENYLPQGVAALLADSYRFLRNVEHAIQAYQDKQSQLIPQDEKNQLRLALMMGFENWQAFYAELQNHLTRVSEQFQAVIASPEKKQSDALPIDPSWELLWQRQWTDQQATEFLAQRVPSVEEVAPFLEALQQLRESHSVMGMQAAARERLDQLMPKLLSELQSLTSVNQEQKDIQAAETSPPAVTLQRISEILEAVARRSAYIVLLLENPTARAQLIRLCSASSWISKELAAHPALLDELLDSRTLYSPPDLESLRDELRRDVVRLPWDDLEAHMESLRYFRLSHALRVAACEVTEILPLMKVSDYLTYIAEVILDHVLQLAWHQMIARHGRPGRALPEFTASDSTEQPATGAADEMDFIVVAYGKLGGIELGHGSDLDLVFVHAADISLETEGPRSIDNATFFARLGQKIIHILNTHTVSGQLYEIDMRLRPSGNSGLLVTSLAALEKYQRENAWVWEHQALVRARVVAGSENLARAFEELRRDILCQQRDLNELRQQVLDMREKMRAHLGSKSAEHLFNIKQDSGGIVDIEFMVQYAVLAWGHREPDLVTYTDNIRILLALQLAKLMAAETAGRLIEIYKTYRSTVHRLALQGLPAVVSDDQFDQQREVVLKAWVELFESSVKT